MNVKSCFAIAIALASVALAQTARAETTALLNCWDGSFAYNTARIETVEGQPNLLAVDLASQNQETFLKSIDLSPKAFWGQALISFDLNRADCVTSTPGRPDLMTCQSQGGILVIQYHESIETQKILNLPIRKLSFETKLNGNALEAKLEFDAGSIAPGSVSMGFFALGGKCKRSI